MDFVPFVCFLCELELDGRCFPDFSFPLFGSDESDRFDEDDDEEEEPDRLRVDESEDADRDLSFLVSVGFISICLFSIIISLVDVAAGGIISLSLLSAALLSFGMSVDSSAKS